MRFKIATHTLKTTLSVVSQCLAQNMVQKMTQNWPQNSAALQIRVESGPKAGPDLTQIMYPIGAGIFKSKKNKKIKFYDFSMAWKVWADFLVFFKIENFLGIKFFSNFTLKWRQNLLFFEIPPQLKKNIVKNWPNYKFSLIHW